jgi:hypothetical protein
MVLRKTLCAIVALATTSLWALPPTDPAELPSPRPGFVPGYLPSGSWVDSLALTDRKFNRMRQSMARVLSEKSLLFSKLGAGAVAH